MKFTKSTEAFEAWLREQTLVVEADLAIKHARMAEGPFPFLRATFYHWMQLWPELCGDLAKAPRVLGVGDLHIENFGTWRDAEGRLVWGINDFDEAAELPYTVDLVRLATSARIAVEEGLSLVGSEPVASLILDGYRRGLERRGRAFVLEESRGWLRRIAINELRDPRRFHDKLASLAECPYTPPNGPEQILMDQLPAGATLRRIAHRTAGLGSLGRRRLTAIADWHGSVIAREGKPLLPSAVSWAAGKEGAPRGEAYRTILERAVRCPDPFLKIQDGWVYRRLAADCSAIELAHLPIDLEQRVLRAMGAEVANIHLGSPRAAKRILADLDKRPAGWLSKAALAMAGATRGDWETWRAKQLKAA